MKHIYTNGKRNEDKLTYEQRKISYRGAIAHEIIGHYEAWIGDFECTNHYIDEAQASIRAARFAPDLSMEERIT